MELATSATSGSWSGVGDFCGFAGSWSGVGDLGSWSGVGSWI